MKYFELNTNKTSNTLGHVPFVLYSMIFNLIISFYCFVKLFKILFSKTIISIYLYFLSVTIRLFINYVLPFRL